MRGRSVLIQMQLTLPRDARHVKIPREVAACILGQIHAPADVVDDMQLAVTEACANVVRHAVGCEEYSVRFRVGATGCEIDIIDDGPGFDREAVPPVSPEAESGRGLSLVDALVDRCELVTGAGDTRVRLVKRWDDIVLPSR
jgi:serine/threonine-protein kinase RsbW